MLDIAVMIEGQDGTNWPRWQNLCRTAEAAGFAGLFRSDHFTNPSGPVKDALELWTSQVWLAANTRRIVFGPLVSPVSFRDPVVTAWTAGALDVLSEGRFRLGLGAGWQEREHGAFGYDLLDIPRRFARFEEALAVITRLLASAEPATFQGEFYRLDGAVLLPRPHTPGGPPIVIGGNGPRRTLPLVARYAQEWNAVSAPAARIGELNQQLDELLRARGRQPGEVLRSIMTTVVFGRDEAELEQRLAGRSAAELRGRGSIVGTAPAVLDQLRELAAAGMQRVMLRWWDQDDMAGLAALGAALIPHL